MLIAVIIKRVPDPASLEVSVISGELDKKRLVYIANPSDLRAVEEALRIRDVMGGHVHVFCMGPVAAEDTLRECLGMGVDRVLRIWGGGWMEDSPPSLTALAMAQYLGINNYDLILTGDAGDHLHIEQLPAWIAGILGLPLATAVTSLKVNNPRAITVQRKLEKGWRQNFDLQTPAVVAVDLSINEPRESALPSLINALESEIDTVDIPVESVARMFGTPGQTRVNTPYIKPLRVEPRIIFTPDSSLPAEERIDQLVSGGMPGKKGKTIEGRPGEVAEQILTFLTRSGLLVKPSVGG